MRTKPVINKPGKFYRKYEEGLTLFVRMTPKAAKNAINGIMEHTDGKFYLNIHICAVPEKAQANKALIKFLGKTLKIAPSSISLSKGQTTRFKHLAVRGNKDDLQQKLAELSEKYQSMD